MNIKLSKKTIIELIILFAAVTIVISGFGKVRLSPFKTSVDFQCSSLSCEDADGGIAIEIAKQTVYFYNSDKKLIGLTDMDAEGGRITVITDASIENDEYIITGYKAKDDGVYIISESVLAFSRDGDFLREVKRVDYDAEDYITIPKWGRNGEKGYFSVITSVYSMKLQYSAAYLVSNLIYWISIVVIFVLIVLLVIKLFKNGIIRKNKAIVIPVCCVLLTLLYYSAYMAIQIVDYNENMITTVSKQLSIVLEENSSDYLSDASDTGITTYLQDERNVENLEEIQNTLAEINDANTADYSYFSTIYAIDRSNSDDPRVFTFMDSRGIISPGLDVTDEIESFYSDYKEGEAVLTEVSGTLVLTCYRYIYDEADRPIAIVCFNTFSKNIKSNINSSLEPLVLNLLAIFILLYVVYILCGSFYQDIKSLRARDRSDRSGRALDMCGIFMFVFQIANTIDEVILVYVAKSLCVDMPPALEATLVALPLAASGAGRWIGTFFSGPVIKKLGERRTGVLASALGIVAMLFMMMAVLEVNIYVLIVCKFAQGVLLSGFMYVLGDTLPLNATGEEEKNIAINHSQMSVIGAEIVAALFGGYLSQYIGYQLVYASGAVMCGLLLITTVITFTNKKRSIGKADNAGAIAAETLSSRSTSLKESWTVFLKKPMLLYIVLYLIPFVLIAGYKNYIFPMYTAGAGMSVLLLSNISVYAKAFTFLIDDPLKQLSLKMKYHITMLVPPVIFCLGLIYFLLCPNVLWAVVMYLGIAVVKRMASVGQKIYIADVAEEYNVDGKMVQSNYYTIESGAYVLQSPVLSLFVSIGTYVGSALVGAVSGVMFILFELFRKKYRSD